MRPTGSRSSGGAPHAAFFTYAQDPKASDEAWTLAQPLPAALAEPEKARVGDDSYDLLLMLSQAADPAEGLRILDRAVKLRPQTTAAYHLRRVDSLWHAGDLVGRDRENREAGLIKPATAVDFFLSGRELMLGRQFADAVRPLQLGAATRSREDLAHLLLAVSSVNMQPKGLSQAWTSLTMCIRSRRDLVGIYLMRALHLRGAGERGPRQDRSDAPR